MAGRKIPANPWAAILGLGLSLFCQQSIADEPPRDGGVPSLTGTSPGERSAIQTLCEANRSPIARSMCYSNQLVGLLRVARKPDLSGLTSSQRADISGACGAKSIPSDRFACERTELKSAGLPVHDEPGGGPLHAEPASTTSPVAAMRTPKNEQAAGIPFFSLEKWRAQRPAMPTARITASLNAEALYKQISPSIYVVVASEHALELVDRTAHSQGSAVAITDRILLTNCHVVAGKPQISLSQQGQTSHATLVYADSGGDRCFLRADDMTVRPVQGVRRFDELRVGEQVFSLGTPVGLELSFGEGIISGLREFEGVRMIQNSAPTWHGSSGGGLFDAHGNLVGITMGISPTVPNLNFSIAAEDFWP